MDLQTYMITHNLSRKDVAYELDLTYNYVCQIIRGNKIPGRRIAEQIEKMTKGKVPKDYILWPKKRPFSKKRHIETNPRHLNCDTNLRQSDQGSI